MNFSAMVKSVLGTFLRGFLLGAGFAIGFGILYLGVFPPLSAEVERRSREAVAQLEISPKDIVLTDLREQEREGVFTITGLATNSGKTRAIDVVLQADFFDHGAFVDQCSDAISGPLDPGASRHFKMDCARGRKLPTEHDSYKVVVLGSRWP